MKKAIFVFFLAAGVLPAAAASAQSSLLQQIEAEFVGVAEKVLPSVVSIQVQRPFPEGFGEGEIDVNDLRRFFGLPTPDEEDGGLAPPRMPRPHASGSGFIYDASGHIITNNHVVEDAERIDVTLANGDEFEAEVVGLDAQSDVAVIKIEADKPLPPAALGDSTGLRVGQFAIAVGSPHNLDGSLSFGHITALGRDQSDEIALPDMQYYDFIQTDAAINFGSSGGPLCNISGEVVGINTAIVWGADSLGFAIPINTAAKFVPALIAEGRVTRGYLGVQIEDLDRPLAEALGLADRRGAFVQNVYPGTPAEEAGLTHYDVIRKVNGRAIESSADLMNKIAGVMPGETVNVSIWRDGAILDIDVPLAERPDDPRTARADGTEILGIRLEPLTDELRESLELEPGASGIIVRDVEPDTPGYEAGLQRNDVLMEAVRQPLETPEQFAGIVDGAKGKNLLLRVQRPGRAMPIVAVLPVPGE